MKKNLPELEQRNEPRQIQPPQRVIQQRQQTTPIDIPVSETPYRVAQYAAATGGGKATNIVHDMLGKGLLTQDQVNANRNIAQRNAAADRQRATISQDVALFNSMTPEEQQALRTWEAYQPGGIGTFTMEQSGVGMSVEEWARINEPYKALVNKYGQDAVDRMVESVTRHDNAQEAAAIEAGTGQYQRDGGLDDFATARIMGVGSWFTAPVGRLHDRVISTGRFSGSDPNNWGALGLQEKNALDANNAANSGRAFSNILEGASRLGQALDGNVTPRSLLEPYTVYDSLDDQGKKAMDVLGSIGYQAAASVADDALRTLAATMLGGGNPAIAKIINSGLAATSAFSAAHQQYSADGYTNGQAVLMASIEAATEALTEALGFDNLMDIVFKGDTSILKSVLKQGFSELGEETIGYLANWAANSLILGQDSAFNRSVDAYMNAGYSRNEAFWRTVGDKGIELAETGAVSFLSGGASGGGGALIGQTVLGNQNGANQQQGQPTTQAQQETLPQTQQQTPALPEGKGSETPALPQGQETQPHYPAPVERAVTSFRENGTVTNSMAEAVLADGDSLAALQEQTGAEISGTKSEQRKAVKAAIAQIAGQEQTQNTAQAAQEAPQAPQPADQQAAPTPRTTVEAAVPKPTAAQAQNAAMVQQPAQQNEQLTNQQQLDRAIQQTLRGTRDLPADQMQSQRPQAGSPQRVDAEEQSAAGGQIKGTGAAEANFSGKQQFENLLGDDNVQPDRATDARPAEMIRYDAQGRRVSDTAKNLVGAEVTSEEMADEIQRLSAVGAFSFDKRTNKEAMNQAAAEIKERGVEATKRDITARTFNGKVKDGDIAKAMLLYARYTKKGDIDNASEMAVDLATLGNRAGRDLQLFRILRMMTPEGQLMAVQKTVQRGIDRLNKGRSAKNQIAPFTIPEPLAAEYISAAKAASGKERGSAEQARLAEVEEAIYMYAGSQIKATFAEKWNAWRYMAMLGNAKTQIRNIVGNAAFVPYKAAKDAIGTAIERIALPQDQRTKAILNPTAEGDRALISWANQDARTKTIDDVLRRSAKLGDNTAKSTMMESRRIFDNDLLEKAREITQKIPEWGDMLFKGPYYSMSLAGFLKARGYTAAQASSGAIPETVMTEAREYAVQEAMRATFNDTNAIVEMLSRRYEGRNPLLVVGNALLEGGAPFRKTPINIVRRAFDYSPIGIIKTIVRAKKGLKTGEYSAAAMIDGLSAGLTGSAAMVLGWALASGLFGFRLRGGGVDEDEKRRGVQNYSIDTGDYSYTVDWAAPANLPLFVGANLYDAFHGAGADDSVSAVSKILWATMHVVEPMLELSCLSGLSDILDANKYSDNNAIYATVAQAATNYFTQGIPALLRQTWQATQGERQTTFANSNDPLLRDIQRTAANIPFLGNAFKTADVDAWGDVESTGGVGERLFNAYFNPGTLRAIDNSRIEQEISRLNGVVPDGVSPPDAARTITYTDEDGNRHENHRLTEKEWQKLARAQGDTAQELLNDVLDSDLYAELSPEQQAKVFDYVYDFARETGRAAALNGYVPNYSGWMRDVETYGADAILRQVVAAEFTDGFTMLTNGEDGAIEKLAETRDLYNTMSKPEQERLLEANGGRLRYYIHAAESGVSTATFAGLYMDYREIDGSQMGVSEKANAWRNVLQQSMEAGNITREQLQVMQQDMGFRYSGNVDTDKYDAMSEAGLDSDQASAVVNLLAGLEPEPLRRSVTDTQRAEAIVDSAGLSEADTRAVLHIYLNDSQDDNLDEMIAMGFDSGDYVTAWRMYSDESGTGKKARVIQQYMREFGVDYATAKAIYEVYSTGSPSFEDEAVAAARK